MLFNLRWLSFVLLYAAGCAGSQDSVRHEDHTPPLADAQMSVAPSLSPEKKTETESDSAESIPAVEDSCEWKISQIEGIPDYDELVRYYKALPEILIGASVQPVIYLRPPAPTTNGKALDLLEQLNVSRRPALDVKELLEKYKHRKGLLRKMFLREGYLFHNIVGMARSLVRGLRIGHLFDDKTVYLYRDSQIQKLTRKRKDYFFDDGAKAKLLLNDRLGLTPESLAQPLHFDLDFVRAQTGVWRIKPLVVGESEAGVVFVFPNGEARKAVIALEDGTSKVVCIGGDPKQLSETQSDAEDFWNRHQKLVEVIESLVKEAPEFDEPKDEPEDAQEDGELRMAWYQAYKRGKKTFFFREVEYPVFDRRGNPVPPQVCIDFYFDAWERAMGNWYRRKGRRPGRTYGELDVSIIEGLRKRQIPSVLNIAAEEGSPLVRYDIPRRDRKPVKDRRRFARGLARHTDHIIEGDGLIIHGLREEDMAEHYHALIVLRTDPLTGMPMRVADNAGRPKIRSILLSMINAPRRSVKHRIRIDFDAYNRLEREVVLMERALEESPY